MTDRLKVLEELGAEFERVAAREKQHGRRRRGRTIALSLVVAGSVSAAALAAGGVLTGEPVKDPPGVVAEPTVGAGVTNAATLTALRVADPAGGPPWGLRTVKTTRELGCVQIGRVVQGRLGVLGQDGAFGNDGRFHEKPASLSSGRDCQPLDAAGRTFIAISYQGLPASGAAPACVIRRIAGTPRRSPLRTLPLCTKANLRILYYGTLGPEARSVTYLDESGRPRTARTAGPDGAYLVVLRPSAKRPAKGYFVPTVSPGSGLRSVRSRDGHECHIRSPRALGGAKRCPRVGYQSPRTVPVTTADVRSPVQARFAPRPVDPSPRDVPASPVWKLTLTFTARLASDSSADYVYTVVPDRARRCRSTSGGSVARDVRAGERVTVTAYVPTPCRGLVRGRVAFHQRGSEPDPLGFAGSSPSDPLVGTYRAMIPGRP